MSFSSPAMKPQLFVGNGTWSDALSPERKFTMTVQGTVTKTAFLLLLCVAAAVGTWMLIVANPALGLAVFIGSAILSIVLSLVLMFAPGTAPYVAPVYALAEGVLVGAMSFVYSKMMAGTKVGGATGTMVVANASLITFCILGGMLALYKLRIINATAKFKAVMMVCGMGIALYSLVMLVLFLFGVNVGAVYQGPLGLVISVGILIYSAFMLILDFDMVEQGAAAGAPRSREWYASFAILMTLVWIYLNVLRVLSLLSKRD